MNWTNTYNSVLCVCLEKVQEYKNNYMAHVGGSSDARGSDKGVEEVVGEPRLDHRVLLEPRVRVFCQVDETDRGREIDPLGFAAMVAS